MQLISLLVWLLVSCVAVSSQVTLTRETYYENIGSRRLLSVLSYEKDMVIIEKNSLSKGHKWNNTRKHSNNPSSNKNDNVNHHSSSKKQVLLFVHIAKTGGSSFDEILKKGVNGHHADCIVEKKHYEDKSIPLAKRYDFPNCHIISTEFSRHTVSKLLLPPIAPHGGERTKHIGMSSWSPLSPSVKFFSLMREPFSRLLSQYRHDKYYTPRRFKECKDLVSLVQFASTCIQDNEPAYRYQNFQTMMLGGCTWNHKKQKCELAKMPVARGGGYVKPTDILAEFSFVGVNEHFEASVCLFYESVGDHNSFKKFCHASAPRATPRMMQGSWIASKNGHTDTTSLDASSLRAAVPTNELDFKLYWQAYDNFIEKAKVVESKTGIPIL
mmetsp:Transcript_14506/g.18818  ORF Transcript_14506/g.18818 Transcript_14506/m.18818 type:complete len:383 (+) Transcript_14506:42-1190(+)